MIAEEMPVLWATIGWLYLLGMTAVFLLLAIASLHKK